MMEYSLINSTPSELLPYKDFIKQNETKLLSNISHYSRLSLHAGALISTREHIKYFQEEISDEPDVLWTMQCDSAISSPLYEFTNHLNQGKEICFQTRGKTLHLVSATGKIIWSKNINEKLRSKIFTVDAFKNKKYQLLFNTDNFLHLIDRNGNYVQGYPVKLPARASNALDVFDYEKTNDLRLFIACADKRIYNYSIWGIKQEGFKPLQTGAEVNLPIKYCKVGLSDYLVTADRNGRIYAFSRKGEGRIDFKNNLLQGLKEFNLQTGTNLNTTALVYVDELNNILCKVSLTDKKEIYKPEVNEEIVSCCFGDFDQNSLEDVFISTRETTHIFDLNAHHLDRIKHTLTAGPTLTALRKCGEENFTVLLDAVNQNLLIYKSAQKELKNYPGSVEPLISILFSDGKKYVLSAQNNKLKCYKL